MKKIFSLLFFLFTNLTFGQMPNKISKEEKIFGLSKFWQEVNYNFVYLSKVDKTEWDKLYLQLIGEVQETKNDYEYYRLLQRFCAFLKDGHTNVWFPQEIQNNIFTSNFGDYRLIVTNIEGKAIITQVNLSKKDELPIGTEITKVNGILTRQYITENVRPYISSSTEHILEDWSISNMLQGYSGTTFNLELKTPSGETRNIELIHSKTEEKELYPDTKTELMEFKWITGDIAYIALNSFSDRNIIDSFSAKLPEIKKAKRLIIDLRKNGGGDTYIAREIFKFLTKDKTIYGSKSQSRLHIPSYKAWGKWAQATDTTNNAWSRQAYLSYRDEFYYNFPYEPYHAKSVGTSRVKIPTVVLIGHNTASAAEDFLVFTSNQKNIIKIGEPTFGSTGQPLSFDLPNGGGARVCTKKDIYPSGKEFVGIGILPDIPINKTLTDYLENRDPVLEKATEYLTKKSLPIVGNVRPVDK
ncbi:MAG: S41 family peptidase [Bacteroidota bacterium]